MFFCLAQYSLFVARCLRCLLLSFFSSSRYFLSSRISFCCFVCCVCVCLCPLHIASHRIESHLIVAQSQYILNTFFMCIIVCCIRSNVSITEKPKNSTCWTWFLFDFSSCQNVLCSQSFCFLLLRNKICFIHWLLMVKMF